MLREAHCSAMAGAFAGAVAYAFLHMVASAFPVGMAGTF